MRKKLIFWFPRILIIIFALFLMIFSFDVFENCNGFTECFLYLMIHNIPSIILFILLAISWRYELFGAIVFGFFGLVGIVGIFFEIVGMPEGEFNPIFIFLGVVFTLVGILFYLSKNQTI